MDNTLMYFNNVYLEKDSDAYEYHWRTANLNGVPFFRARINDAEWSAPSRSKKAAEILATKAYLKSIGNEEEVVRAETYTGHKRPLPTLPNKIPTLFVGDKRHHLESQNLEYKSNRPVPDPQPPSQKRRPFPFSLLKSSVKKHLAKYACAFLNGRFLSPSISTRERSTIEFGVHDDRMIDAYYVNEKEMDELSQQIHMLLSHVEGAFEYEISWTPVVVKDTESSTAFILGITVFPSFHKKSVFAIRQGDLHAFWIRKGPMVVAMSFNEIEDAFSQLNK